MAGPHSRCRLSRVHCAAFLPSVFLGSIRSSWSSKFISQFKIDGERIKIIIHVETFNLIYILKDKSLKEPIYIIAYILQKKPKVWSKNPSRLFVTFSRFVRSLCLSWFEILNVQKCQSFTWIHNEFNDYICILSYPTQTGQLNINFHAKFSSKFPGTTCPSGGGELSTSARTATSSYGSLS